MDDGFGRARREERSKRRDVWLCRTVDIHIHVVFAYIFIFVIVIHVSDMLRNGEVKRIKPYNKYLQVARRRLRRRLSPSIPRALSHPLSVLRSMYFVLIIIVMWQKVLRPMDDRAMRRRLFNRFTIDENATEAIEVRRHSVSCLQCFIFFTPFHSAELRSVLFG